MSFFKKIFGRASSLSSGHSGAVFDPVEHEGYLIVAAPVKEGSQYRLAGTISKEVDGEHKEHKFIRADLFPSAEDCAQFTVTKARQVIREQGDRMFS